MWTAGWRLPGGRGAGTQTRGQMAQAVHRFYAFVEARHGRLVQEVTGQRVPRPVDEFNRLRRLAQVGVRIPSSAREMETLFLNDRPRPLRSGSRARYERCSVHGSVGSGVTGSDVGLHIRCGPAPPCAAAQW
jgi:hypothetical protein